MNDRYDGYSGSYSGDASNTSDQYELVGYDEFGQPVYRQVPQQPPQYGYQQQPPGQGGQGGQADQGGQGGHGGQGYGYDPYATGQQPPAPSYNDMYDPYGAGAPVQQGQPSSYDPYGTAAGTGQQQRVEQQRIEQQRIEQQTATAHIPAQAAPRTEPPARERDTAPEYRTEQFSFVEEPDENSEDVIDWLKFTESRTERREEARRRGRSRVVALVVVLVLCVTGGVGYLWYAGKLPGFGSTDSGKGPADTAGPQNRDVIVVHLHNTKGGGTSTALLVNNTTTKQGTTVLLPNSLALTDDDGSPTTLGKSVGDDGSSGTRDAIDTVLGTDVEGTWRLDTPYLNNLVELVGNIYVDTNTDVPDPAAKSGKKASKKATSPLVKKGRQQTLSGPMAVAYATYRAPGEAESAQLMRFGQVMQGVLGKLSSDPHDATVTVQSLAQILDPSLGDKDLGAFLAKLADRAKGGDYKTALLPVQQDGTLSEQATGSVVKDVLGGTVKNPGKGAPVRVGIKNATGVKDRTGKARVTLINGGYTFVDAGSGAVPQAATQITYSDAGRKQDAVEVAKTLGLPTSAVRKGTTEANADVSVVLGQDYTGGQ
ncbi:LCP family protein [Streptomyces antnestii]|uniref:LCP family protein n=1 Tax=Streptomyces antnestii TaxID=2494256 RepID=UPI001CB96906|nr:LCP family protein [Streptomyces sp. San01]